LPRPPWLSESSPGLRYRHDLWRGGHARICLPGSLRAGRCCARSSLCGATESSRCACNFKGAAGALTDAPVRDVARTRALGFKVFGTGTWPIDINSRYEVVAHNVPGEIDGVEINPGDLIVGDVDGVVVVPNRLIPQVIAFVEEKNSGENLFRKAVKEGMSPSEAFAKFGVL
jgi:regulator of RNase E activity RraA